MPENSNNPKTLHELVSNRTDDGKNRKVVGYSVASYAGVLSALQKAQVISSGYSSNGVMGIHKFDFSSVSSMNYDNNGFSADKTSGIWKMVLTFHGATPVKHSADCWYDIITFPNDSQERAVKMNAASNGCPYYLSDEFNLDFVTTNDFKAGAYIDLSNLGVNYFNTFYANGETFYNEEIVSKLVYDGCVVAQIIFPQKNEYKIVKILGQLPIGKCATVSLTASLLACSGWENTGLSIRIKQNGTNPTVFLPDGIEYEHPCKDSNYYYATGKINKFNKTSYKEEWLPNNTLRRDAKVKASLELPPLQDCFVRLFIPKEFKAKALKIIGTPPNEYIFQEYPGRLVYVKGTDAIYSGTASSIIAGVVNKWSSVGQTTAVGTGTGKIKYDMGNRPYKLQRGRGTQFLSASSSTPFMPTFGHPNNINVYDCSSFVSLVLWDSGVVRDDVTSVPAFNTSQWSSPSIINSINPYLKSQYQAIFLSLNDPSQVQYGDILVITKEERLRYHGHDYSAGHATIACPDGDKRYTIEIGSDKNSDQIKKKGYDYSYYKHIIRIIDKQQQTT